jgi:ABC-type dipeptide/oligopeptide/nickel transport system ATPase component
VANGVLLIGESGSGKSTSIENLNPGETFIINVKNKPLPFKGWKSNYVPFSKENPNGNYIGTDNPSTMLNVMQHVSDKMSHIKHLIIEDFQYMAANEYMNRAKESGLILRSH